MAARQAPATEAQFIERFGLYFERQGGPRIAGQIMAVLLLAEGPLSLEELAKKLKVSKASISTNVTLFERSGMMTKRSLPGDRRHYVEMGRGSFERYFERAMENTLTFGQLCQQALDGLPSGRRGARVRLKSGIECMSLLQKHFQVALAEWRKR